MALDEEQSGNRRGAVGTRGRAEVGGFRAALLVDNVKRIQRTLGMLCYRTRRLCALHFQFQDNSGGASGAICSLSASSWLEGVYLLAPVVSSGFFCFFAWVAVLC